MWYVTITFMHDNKPYPVDSMENNMPHNVFVEHWITTYTYRKFWSLLAIAPVRLIIYRLMNKVPYLLKTQI